MFATSGDTTKLKS